MAPDQTTEALRALLLERILETNDRKTLELVQDILFPTEESSPAVHNPVLQERIEKSRKSMETHPGFRIEDVLTEIPEWDKEHSK